MPINYVKRVNRKKIRTGKKNGKEPHTKKGQREKAACRKKKKRRE